MEGFCGNVFGWYEQGIVWPLSNLSSFQGQTCYLELVIQNEGRLNFLRAQVTNVLQLLDCVNEKSLISSLFNLFLSSYRAQSIYIYFLDSLNSLSAQNKTDQIKARIFLSGVTGIRNCKQSKRHHVCTIVSFGGYWWLNIGYLPSNNLTVYHKAVRLKPSKWTPNRKPDSRGRSQHVHIKL